MERRVVVTGMGMVSPLGDSVKSSWHNLIAGKSGIVPITIYDKNLLEVKIAGEIPRNQNGEDFTKAFSPKDQKRMDRFIMAGIMAADEAIADSGISLKTEEEQLACGVYVGSGVGGIASIEESCREAFQGKRISPFLLPSMLINLASGHISIKHGIRGLSHACVTACATSTHAIGDAFNLIKWGRQDVMVAGGCEAAICQIAINSFSSLKALSTLYEDTPERASRPWDKGRDGFVMGEGAGVLVLEEYEHAKLRGAKIYAEIVGYGFSADAFHVTAPSEDGSGAYHSMNRALKDAKISAAEIDYINAHGTSTPLGDVVELKAIKRLLPNDFGKVPVSSTKSSTGHLLGAAGSVELIFSILAMIESVCPATLNLEDPDDLAAGFNLVPLKPQERSINYALSNSFGFGGTNASLVAKKFI